MDTDDFVKIENDVVSLVFDCRSGVPVLIYYGPVLSSRTPASMLATLGIRQEVNCAPVVEPPLSLMPSYGDGFTGSVGIELSGEEGIFATNPKLTKIDPGKSRVEFVCEDPVRGVRYTFFVALDQDSAVATWQTRLTNLRAGKINLARCAAPTLPLSSSITHLKVFEGRWSAEFQTQDLRISTGSYVRENRRGKTSHDSFPGLIAFAQGASERAGECLAFHLGFSGNHRLCVEKMADGRQFVQMNELLYPGEVTLAENQSYTSPILYSAYSANGFSDLSKQFHAFIRTHLLSHSSKPRPVHYNTWEGLYFEHDVDTLKDLASRAAELGVERFVLDDGWFGTRTSERSGLGDWTVNKAAYPDGLGPLIERVNNLGMEFGIWLEPEMVNPDSDLYRAHPEWVLGSEHNPQVPFRHQYVLDLTQPEVCAYLYKCVASLLDEYPQIKYIKWDMNRDVNHQINYQSRPAMHRQVKALYGLLQKIKYNYPELEIESCCSGGGRVDLGILPLTDRFWTSDSNDPLDRLRIQRGFSFFFPAEIMGAHVGPRDCHITGRHTSMELRAAVAIFGHMGLEMDPRELTEQEKGTLKAAVTMYKDLRGLIHSGELIRLDEDGLHISFGYVNKQKTEAVFAYNSITETVHTQPGRYRFAGLDASRCYRFHCVWPDEYQAHPTSALAAAEGKILSGEALMGVGLQLPAVFPQTALVFRLQAVD